MQRPRMQQTMPEDRNGWHHIDAGPHLEVLFRLDRRLTRREPDQIERPSIVVAVAGKREQALRFDPFSMGAHYHIRPGLAEQIPLPVAEGQTPLDATMAFFEKPLRFRGLLALAEEDDVASQLRDEELKDASIKFALSAPLRERAPPPDRDQPDPQERGEPPTRSQARERAAATVSSHLRAGITWQRSSASR